MSKFPLFNAHIEQFKAEHAKKSVPHRPFTADEVKSTSTFLHLVIYNYFGAMSMTQYDYGLDTPYRIYSCLDPIIQYLAIDLESNIYIGWNEDEPDGIHPARVMQRLLELQGMESELNIDASGSSQMTIYHNGKVTKVQDNHDTDQRQITIDGRSLTPDKYHLIDGYFSLQDCAKQGIHLTDCDDDGFCNFCGENTPFEEIEYSDEMMDMSPGYRALDDDENDFEYDSWGAEYDEYYQDDEDNKFEDES